MNYTKIVKTIIEIMALVGFFLLLGSVGASDYADEIGVYFDFSTVTPHIIIGILLLIPGIIYGIKKGGADHE